MTRRISIVSLALLVIAIAVAANTATASKPAAAATAAATTVTVTPAAGTVRFAVGVTHEHYSADYGDPASVARARALLAAQPIFQNQSLMGWGAGNPEPAPGTYDWASLDARVALIRSTGGIPVITLCGAPDWMKGGQPGTTDWSKLAVAPTPSHFADFAALARQVALRYPDVHFFQVWNELKGFWNVAANRWDYEGYTALYNDVYSALKGVNPNIQVGGPYVVMDSLVTTSGSVSGAWGSVDHRALDVVSYWLAHKRGADFLAIDGSSYPKWGTPAVDEFALTQKFAAVDQWLRARTTMPIWWSELYVQPAGVTWSTTHQAAVFSAGLAQLIASGASTALLWGPEEQDPVTRPFLWTRTLVAGGGLPTPLYPIFESIDRAYKASAQRATITLSEPTLVAAGSTSQILAVNATGRTLTVQFPTRSASLASDGVVVTPP